MVFSSLQSCAITTTINIRTFSSALPHSTKKKKKLYPLLVSHFPLSQPLLSISIDLPLWTFHINGIRALFFSLSPPSENTERKQLSINQVVGSHQEPKWPALWSSTSQLLELGEINFYCLKKKSFVTGFFH